MEKTNPQTDPLQDAPQAQETLAEELAPRPVRYRRAWLFEGYVLATVLVFSLLAYLASTRAYSPVDLTITHAFQSVQAPWFAALMRAVSWPGFPPQTVLLTLGIVLALFLMGLRREAGFAALAGLGTQLLNVLIKLVVARPRPSADLVTVQSLLTDYSFPSGHVMYYCAFFGFLGFLSYTLLRRSWQRSLLLFLFGGLVVAVGPSRIYLGQHWASDVTGAYLLGSLCLVGVVLLYRRLRPAKKKSIQKK